jgi:hypothetical protein
MTGRGKDGFSLLSLPLESFTKNLDAQRRNEELLFCSPKTALLVIFA